MSENGSPQALSVIVVGAGIGGLACAIACRREGLDVKVLEQVPEIKPVSSNPLSLPGHSVAMVFAFVLEVEFTAHAYLTESVEPGWSGNSNSTKCKPRAREARAFGARQA